MSEHEKSALGWTSAVATMLGLGPEIFREETWQ